jgi:hypothetical protein
MTTLLHSQKLMLWWGIGVGVFVAILRILFLDHDTLAGALITIPIAILGFSALGLVGYVIYCFIRGGSFIASYTLDKNNLHENYVPRKVKKLPDSQGLSGLIEVLTSPGPGFGYAWATGKSTSTMPLKRIRTIKARRRLSHIKVSLGLEHLYVYVSPADFDTIFTYLCDHCPQAKATGHPSI